MSRIGTSLELKSGFLVAQGWKEDAGSGEGGTANEGMVSFWGDDNVLIL